MKTLATSSLALFLLCAPAAADPAPAPPPSSLRLHLALRDGKRTNTFLVDTAPQACADVRQRSADRDDQIKVCSGEETAKGVRLDIEWRTRTGPSEYEARSTIVLARGAKTETGGDDVRLAVQLQ